MQQSNPAFPYTAQERNLNTHNTPILLKLQNSKLVFPVMLVYDETVSVPTSLFSSSSPSSSSSSSNPSSSSPSSSSFASPTSETIYKALSISAWLKPPASSGFWTQMASNPNITTTKVLHNQQCKSMDTFAWQTSYLPTGYTLYKHIYTTQLDTI